MSDNVENSDERKPNTVNKTEKRTLTTYETSGAYEHGDKQASYLSALNIGKSLTRNTSTRPCFHCSTFFLVFRFLSCCIFAIAVVVLNVFFFRTIFFLNRYSLLIILSKCYFRSLYLFLDGRYTHTH